MNLKKSLGAVGSILSSQDLKLLESAVNRDPDLFPICRFFIYNKKPNNGKKALMEGVVNPLRSGVAPSEIIRLRDEVDSVKLSES